MAAGALFYKDIKSFITDHVRDAQTSTCRRLRRRASRAPTVGARPVQLPVHDQRAHRTAAAARSRAPSSRSRSRSGADSASRRITRTRTRRPTTATRSRAIRRMQFNVIGYFENQRLERTAGLQLSLGVLRRIRPVDAAEPGGDSSRSTRRSTSICTDSPDADLRGVRTSPSEEIDAVCGRLVFGPRAIYDNGRIYYAGVRFRY